MPARNILSLANKVALITGAAAPLGIGRATAALFAENGARVVVTDLVSQRTRGMETVADIRREGGTAIFVPLDVSNEQDWIAAIEEWVCSVF
jgi:NAD(P)-dependent dehydrogenase (short-subunit alcohol dehydrogenase family)